MTTRRFRLPLLVATLAVAIVPPATARAKAYPVNVCVGTKQKLAGGYCKAALKAWAKFETSGDSAKRDAALAKAAGKLGPKWTAAETKSLAGGSDCADTTLAATAAVQEVDSAVAALVGEVNGGLDLGDKTQAKCAASILKAAGGKCAAFLGAEGKFVGNLAKDPQGTKRAASESKA